MQYVIVRDNDNGRPEYVTMDVNLTGSSYVRDIRFAKRYPSAESARRDACGNESVVSVESQFFDGRTDPVNTGPNTRTGQLSATFLVRGRGEIAPAVSVDMIGSADGKSVLVRVTDDRTGAVVLEFKSEQ